jgi:dTDP-4-dehydrorhamnose 3,5-epimerase-like enzyme
MTDLLKEFPIYGDSRGKLIVLEGGTDVPFSIRRIFYIYGTQKNISRGNHAHYQSKQLLVVVSGSCKITLDDGAIKKTYNLNKSNIGLIQDKLIWGVMHSFSSDCVLLVLSDSYYNENDYIRDYSKFSKIVANDS